MKRFNVKQWGSRFGAWLVARLVALGKGLGALGRGLFILWDASETWVGLGFIGVGVGFSWDWPLAVLCVGVALYLPNVIHLLRSPAPPGRSARGRS